MNIKTEKMKTSNILILSAVVGLFIFITILIFAEKANYKNKLKNNTDETTKGLNSKDLESFKILKIADDAYLNIISSEQNKLFYNDKADIENNVIVKNDTLYIGGDDIKLTLNAKEIRTVILSDDAVINIVGVKMDSLNVYMHDDAHLICKDVNISNLQLYTNDNSEVYINNSSVDDVFLQAKANSYLRLFCKMKKISGNTTPDTKLIITKVKNINLQAEGRFSMINKAN